MEQARVLRDFCVADLVKRFGAGYEIPKVLTTSATGLRQNQAYGEELCVALRAVVLR